MCCDRSAQLRPSRRCASSSLHLSAQSTRSLTQLSSCFSYSCSSASWASSSSKERCTADVASHPTLYPMEPGLLTMMLNLCAVLMVKVSKHAPLTATAVSQEMPASQPLLTIHSTKKRSSTMSWASTT